MNKLKNISSKIIKINLLIFVCYSIGNQSIFADVNIIKNINYKTSDTSVLANKFCNLDLLLPLSKNELPTLIFFHGGGLTAGEKLFLQPFIDGNELIVVAPDYRLSPTVKCPTYIEDAAAAVAWVFENIKNYGGSTSKIFLSGYSSGAYLANMIYLDKSYLGKYGVDPDSLAGIFSLSSQMTTHFTVMAERGISTYSDNKIIDNYAPLYFTRNVKPYTMLLTGDSALDMPGRNIQNKQMYDSLKFKGSKRVEYIKLKNKDHGTLLDTAALISKLKIKELVTIQALNYVEKRNINFNIRDDDLIFTDNFNIKKMSFYNLDGVLLSEVENNKILNIKNLKSGIYIIKIITDDQIYTEKIIF